MYSGSRTGLTRLAALLSHLLALEPELPDLLWHLVNAIKDLFIGPTSVVYDLTLKEPVVEKGANRALGEGFAIPDGVSRVVQLLGQSPEGLLAFGVSSEGAQQSR